MKYAFHKYANLFPLLEESDLKALAADIAANGLHERIWLYEGEILDGRNRYLACLINDMEPRYQEYAGDSPLAFVVSLNLARRHLSAGQRAMLAVDLLPELELEAKRRMESGTNQYSPTQIIAEGEKGEAREKAAEMVGANRQYVSDAKKLQSESPDLAEKVRAGEISLPEAKRQMSGNRPHVANNSGQNEWYTPAEIIEAARVVMGGIDLDPASSEAANRVVKAARFFSLNDDGLNQEWAGRVWMNPPYSQPAIRQFCEKLFFEWDRISSAIVLVNNATETRWFQLLLQNATAVCFISGRLKFLDTQGNPSGAPLQGQVILYYGIDRAAFTAAFLPFGIVMHG